MTVLEPAVLNYRSDSGTSNRSTWNLDKMTCWLRKHCLQGKHFKQTQKQHTKAQMYRPLNAQ